MAEMSCEIENTEYAVIGGIDASCAMQVLVIGSEGLVSFPLISSQ